MVLLPSVAVAHLDDAGRAPPMQHSNSVEDCVYNIDVAPLPVITEISLQSTNHRLARSMLLSSAQRLEPTDRLQLSFAMPQAEQCLLVDHAARFDDESESGSNGTNRCGLKRRFEWWS